MEDNHQSVEEGEKRIHAELQIIKDPKVATVIKKKALQKAKNYMHHLENVDSKMINGKKYNYATGDPDDTPMNQKELDKLIENIDSPDEEHCKFTDQYNTKALMLEGAYVTNPSNDDYDKGWSTPKIMNPSHMFK